MSYYFYGVEVGRERRVGYINSGELINSYNESWIPEYQRERILKPRKINALINIFKTGAPIDSIKLNLKGKILEEEGEAILDGTFHVIDGQQRLSSLKDSGVQDYRMPVELYVNLPYDQEVALFHQFNTDGTRLTFGELVKSYVGPMAEYVRRIMASKNYPVVVSINNSRSGLPLTCFCPVLYWVHRKMTRNVNIKTVKCGRNLKHFMQDTTYTKRELDDVEFATRSILNAYVGIFGSYDFRAISYKRAFFLSVCHVFIDNFLTNSGTIDFGRFKAKASLLPSLLKSSFVKELTETGSGDDSMYRLYNAVVEHFNHKLRADRLLSLGELHGNADGDDDDLEEVL